MSVSLRLDALNHDILTCIFTVLPVPDILRFRQASRRLYLISEQHAVWMTACTNDIFKQGIPFPKRPLTSFSASDLKRHTLHAYRLGLNWRSPTTALHHAVSSPQKGGAVEHIKFISRRGRCWIVTTSLAIWWTLSVRDCDSLEVVAEWSPGKALLNGIAVNADGDSEAAIAVSVHRNSCMTVEILAIADDATGGITIQPRRTLDTSRKPIALNGDLVALCDHYSETLILNWKTQEQGLLRSPDTWQDKPLHVVFAHGSILVARARSICIFHEPRMALPGDDLDVALPHVFKSFGWVDGVSLASGPCPSFLPTGLAQPSLSLLLRNKGDDPWRPTEQFQFMMSNADLNHTAPQSSHDTSSVEHEALSFPFNQICTLSSHHRSPLRCSDMVLGSYGTAVWVQPSDWAAVGLITDNSVMEGMPLESPRETLIVALFPGLLSRGFTEAHVKVAVENHRNSWTCLDYDEARGLIALGSNAGGVTLYRL